MDEKSEFMFFNPDDIGYKVPEEILRGDFRKLPQEEDHDRELAMRLVSDYAREPSEELAQAVYREYGRFRQAFDNVRSLGDAVSTDAYLYTADLFHARINALLRGEQELPER